MSSPMPDAGPERTRWIADRLAEVYEIAEDDGLSPDAYPMVALREVMAEKQALLADQLGPDLDYGEPE